MLHHRSARHHSSNLLRSTPDLTVDQKPEKSSRSSSWRTHSAIVQHKTTNSDSRSRGTEFEDYCNCSPSRRPRAVSPQHNRSLSFRTMKRPTAHQMQCEETGCTGGTSGFRPRGSTMPSDSASYYLARRRMR